MKNIIVENLCKKHQQNDILKSISFEAKQGRVTAFLGPNGAGKSSTLRILLGLDYATSGSAIFGDEKYTNIQQPLHVVGAVFDGIGGVPTRTVKTHLRMIAQSNQIPNKRVDEVLEMTKIVQKRGARLGTLSLGEGQRLGLASALLGDPQYLVLDEPTNGLDPIGMRWFKEFIRNQASKGKTILISSHFLAEIEEIADDVVVLHDGEIKICGDIHSVTKDLKSLEDVFFNFMDKE